MSLRPYIKLHLSEQPTMQKITCIYIYMYTYIYVYSLVNMHIHIYTQILLSLSLYIFIYKYTCIHIYIYTDIYTCAYLFIATRTARVSVHMVMQSFYHQHEELTTQTRGPAQVGPRREAAQHPKGAPRGGRGGLTQPKDQIGDKNHILSLRVQVPVQ